MKKVIAACIDRVLEFDTQNEAAKYIETLRDKGSGLRIGMQTQRTTITAKSRINRLWQGLNILSHGAAVTVQGQNIHLPGCS